MNIRKYFCDHLFFYPVVLGIVIMSIVSFNRFIINNDYLVYYEGQCDPSIQSCFEYCEDDDCTYYAKVQKKASDVYAQCGRDVTDCEQASSCLSSDQECSITYCDSTSDEDCAMQANDVPEETSDSSDIIQETI